MNISEQKPFAYLRTIKTKSCFTLIELMIVISIIAIMASMLLPALSKARDQAKAIKCVGNLKQSGLALSLYWNDFDDWFYHSPTLAPKVYWSKNLLNNQYIKDFSSVRCTYTSTKYPATADPKTWHDASYGAGARTADLGYHLKAPGYSKYAGGSVWEIKVPPSKLFIIGCSRYTTNDYQFACLLLNFDTATSWGRLHLIHSGRANGLMYDGHVEQISKNDLAVVKFFYPSQADVYGGATAARIRSAILSGSDTPLIY